ncbi:MAG: DciA family protein [Alphaproteobacteria bacterium]|nr:DciA family protein [Alphaproteobacteria bacterium]
MTARSKPASKEAQSKRSAPGLRSIAAPVSKVARPMLKRRGLAGGRIVAEWPQIVGVALAKCSCPEKLSPARGENDGVLRIRVDGPLAIELQHLEPQIIERINGYFGYRAVGRLAMVRGPLPKPPPPRPRRKRAPNPAAAREAAQHFDQIGDDELKAALESLGRAVLGEAGAEGG